MEQHIEEIFHQSVRAIMNCGEELAPAIASASQRLSQCFINDNKVLICGTGSSAALAQLASSLFIHRFEQDRPGLPALCIHGDSSTMMALSGDQSLLAKPIRALGHDNDVLLIISGGVLCGELVQAIRAAHERGMKVIALTTTKDNDLRALLTSEDQELLITEETISRLQEIQLLIIHSLCNLVDQQLFGDSI